MEPHDFIRENSLWIFGYGSLVWKPDFAYKRSQIGHITGYKRRFWHGDDFYRGDKEKVNTYLTYFGPTRTISLFVSISLLCYLFLYVV